MTDNYNYERKNLRYRQNLFKISFLVFQLIFCSLTLFYILRKHQIGMDILGVIAGKF
jgi:hypothetical protein